MIESPPVMASCIHPEWALCLGGASCVWDDVSAWEKIYGKQWDGLVIAANDIGAHWPRELDAWVSLHPYKFKKWRALREELGYPSTRHYETWGKPLSGGMLTDRSLVPWAGGSTGMLAIQVALELKCVRAILCGTPMTHTAHFAETKESFAPQWQQASAHWKVWPRNLPRMLGWVKSMSGRTQELLGAPTAEWLQEVNKCS